MKRVAHRLTRFRALDPAQRRTLLACAVCLPIFSLALRVLGFARFHGWLKRTGTHLHGANPTDVQSLGRLVNVAARYSPVPVSCLTRSLLLEWLLRRRDIASQLRIGVRLRDRELEAHAWVECDGVPINDRADIASDFTPFAALIPASAFRAA